LYIGEIRQRIHWRINDGPGAPDAQKQRAHQHQKTVRHRATNNPFNHWLFPQCAWVALSERIRSSAPEILASESIRNRPLETTFSPSARPERNAVTPCDAWKTATRFGTKRPSASTVITRCSLPVSISACDGMSSIGSLAVLSCNQA